MRTRDTDVIEEFQRRARQCLLADGERGRVLVDKSDEQVTVDGAAPCWKNCAKARLFEVAGCGAR